MSNEELIARAQEEANERWVNDTNVWHTTRKHGFMSGVKWALECLSVPAEVEWEYGTMNSASDHLNWTKYRFGLSGAQKAVDSPHSPAKVIMKRVPAGPWIPVEKGETK